MGKTKQEAKPATNQTTEIHKAKREAKPAAAQAARAKKTQNKRRPAKEKSTKGVFAHLLGKPGKVGQRRNPGALHKAAVPKKNNQAQDAKLGNVERGVKQADTPLTAAS